MAYLLKLLLVMRIYSIVSIAQLESGHTFLDSYKRRVNINSSLVIEDGDDSDPESKPYEIETLLEKKIFRGKVYYLVKWKDCGNEHNV